MTKGNIFLSNEFFKKDTNKKLLRSSKGRRALLTYMALLIEGSWEQGYIYYRGYEDNFIKELPYRLGIEESELKESLELLSKAGLIEEVDGGLYLVEAYKYINKPIKERKA